MAQLLSHFQRNVLRLHRSSRGFASSEAIQSSFLVNDPKYGFLKELGLKCLNSGVYNGQWTGCGEITQSIDPSSGAVIAEVQGGTEADLEECIRVGHESYAVWSRLPAPRRGEIVRQIGDELRKNLQPLGTNLKA